MSHNLIHAAHRSLEATTRRQFLQTATAASAVLTVDPMVHAVPSSDPSSTQTGKAQIAITLDLEMARNFPTWEETQWDYEKGNLSQAAKDYTVGACQRVLDRGGVIHTFVVGQVFEQENVDWLKQIAAAGHPIGNHTYDHIYLLAKNVEQLQYRFRRAPWLLRDRQVIEVIRDNIMLTNTALEKRVGVKANGFRTPGGFANALDGREDLQRLLLALDFEWISCRYPAHAGIRDLHGTQEEPSSAAYDNIVKAQQAAQPYLYPTGLIEIPMSPISDIGAFRNGRWQLAHFLKAIRLAMQWVIEEGGVFDFLSHPSCLGVIDPNFQAIDLICDLVEQSRGQAELVSLDAIAQQVRAKSKHAP